MSWKLQLHPPVSKAEIQIFHALSKLRRMQNIVSGMTYTLQEATEDQPEIKTMPDQWDLHQMKFVYIDGDQVHRGTRLEKDETVNELLEQKGIRYLRVHYHAPLRPNSPKEKEIVNEIYEFYENKQG